MDGVDRDLLRPLQRRLKARCEAIHTATRVARIQPESDGLRVASEGENAPAEARFDRALIAVGRRPNTEDLGLNAAGVATDERGCIPVDDRTRTNQPHIHAIGDVTGPPQLAHRATHQGAVAAEVIAGLPAAFEPLGIPAVAYTDPEIAWVGLTEEEAKRTGTRVNKGVFPWSASGRALGSGRPEGLTKLLFSEEDGRLLGDLALTIHPHPTLSETVAFAAEMAAGTITDLLPPKRR
jgi:dihydrolipoamide dehydrogenase